MGGPTWQTYRVMFSINIGNMQSDLYRDAEVIPHGFSIGHPGEPS